MCKCLRHVKNKTDVRVSRMLDKRPVDGDDGAGRDPEATWKLAAVLCASALRGNR